MSLLALGINHRTAAVDVREQVAFARERIHSALRDACKNAGLSEVAILSTCNRMEMYCVAGPDFQTSGLLDWLGQYHHVPSERIKVAAYEFEGPEAVRHMMRVASGLDSMVLGEPQILGQLKEAYSLAREADTVGPHLGRLFQHTFSVAKQVRTDTSIGANPVSVAYAAVALSKRIFADISDCTALLVGAGETIQLVARHLHEQGVKRFVIANRTLARANALAETIGGRGIGLGEIPAALVQSDIVISSTSSPLPIIGKGMVEAALRRRRHKPVFMCDIAVPRDIEEAVSDLADVYLYTVDDLQETVDENRRQRLVAAEEAERIVESRALQFMDSLRALDASGTIREYRMAMDAIRVAEMEKAHAMLKQGVDPAEVLNRAAAAMMNKMLHQPSIQLKKAAEDGRLDLLDWSRQLFGLDDSRLL